MTSDKNVVKVYITPYCDISLLWKPWEETHFFISYFNQLYYLAGNPG